MPNRSTSNAKKTIYSLSYCSRATRNLGSSDIESIVAAARVKNSRTQITGWLVYGSGIFFQWLEGKQEDVERLMAAIGTDTRHDTIVVLSESAEVRERLFGDWDMELVSADDIREVLLDAVGEAKDAKSVEALRTLLKEVDSKALKPGLINNLIDL